MTIKSASLQGMERLVRVALSLALAGAAAKYQNNNWYIAATPLISAGVKYLREKWPDYWTWLPL